MTERRAVATGIDMDDVLRIRAALPSEISSMQSIEIRAARLYETVSGYEFCSQLPPRSRAEHMRILENGAAWVAVIGDKVVGFLLTLPVDGRAHVLEAATDYDSQRKGIGRHLFAEFHAWAADAGFSAATLTTYRDVPWNAPFYARIGYKIIAVDAERPQLMAVQAEEASAGFAREPRVAMEKLLRRR